ncbi:hypothetical protein OM076_07800 [Solirubrobacter ginsenosidimutans]|uniref:Uncharacterized protein n=1 Tax=Solirubrobacter ginsenosidimutans TaxID=490573 RepID=A0A9X3MP21_9ACTN|nr:hypothetical protein [Solirubrobacter ginsenosidimutans]
MSDRVDPSMDAVQQPARPPPARRGRAHADRAKVLYPDEPVLAGGDIGDSLVG